MTSDADLWPLLSRALTYPAADAPALLARCRSASDLSAPDVARLLRQFAADMDGQSVEAMQERFTGAFDFDPKCSLDIGWHLFGENYDRGDFLVRMRETLATHGVDEGVDLPDHLPHVLLALSRMDRSAAADLAGTFVVPALEKILAGLDGQQSPFEHVIRAAHSLVSTYACAASGGAPHV